MTIRGVPTRVRRYNARLSPADDIKFRQVAKFFGHPSVMRAGFPVIMEYLRQSVTPEVWTVISDLHKVEKDTYWEMGTGKTLLNPRQMPKGFHRCVEAEAAARTKTKQQVLTEEDFIHLHAVARYFGARIDDLLQAAVRELGKQSGGWLVPKKGRGK